MRTKSVIRMMKSSLLLFLLLLPCCLDAQLFGDTIPGKALLMPGAKLSSFGGRSRLVTSDSAYKTLFHDSVHHRLPVIDFSTHELVANAYCVHCIVKCEGRPGCHRNACQYLYSWRLRYKKEYEQVKAEPFSFGDCRVYIREPVIIRHDSAFAALRGQCEPVQKLTVDFSRRTFIAQSLYGDCNAQFEHHFFLDAESKTMVWRTFSRYGGCKHGGTKQFMFTIPDPPEGYKIVFENFEIE